MSFGLYAIGFAIMIGGLMYGAHLMHMPTHWIGRRRNRTFGGGDSVWSQGDASERFFEIREWKPG
jgi:hypothetical protein